MSSASKSNLGSGIRNPGTVVTNKTLIGILLAICGFFCVGFAARQEVIASIAAKTEVRVVRLETQWEHVKEELAEIKDLIKDARR